MVTYKVLGLALWMSVLCQVTVARADVIDDYVDLATGEFSSAAQAKTDDRYDAITWHISEIWQDDSTAERWLYIESWIDAADAPYMQRIARVVQQEDGSLSTRRFRFPEPAAFVGAGDDVRRFASLQQNDLIEMKGCDIVLVRTGPQRFEGGTQGNGCRNAYKGASYAVSYGTLMSGGMVNWDRGIAANGEHVWGPASGGYRFDRVGSADACNEPVRMLVFGTISDREKFIGYARAIAASGLYEKYGGYYEGMSPALDVLEGSPPPNRGVIISRFPCLKAAQEFWHSDTYADIRPLRDGIAEFEVLILRSPPIPEWLP